MGNLKKSNELLDAIINGNAFDSETGLIWQHWLDEITKQVDINNVELSAGANESEQQSNCNLPHVSVSLLSDLPENKPLYKDSGLWQLRTDDMDDVIIQQHSDESDKDFLEKCREIQREKERNER